MELAFVVSADRGVMQDERTGKLNNWSNCHYLTDSREDGPDSAGFKPIKAPCTPEAFEVIHQNGVGLYKLDFKTRPGAMGKPTLTLTKVEPVGKIDLFDLGNYRSRQPGQPVRPAAAPAPIEQPKAA